MDTEKAEKEKIRIRINRSKDLLYSYISNSITPQYLGAFHDAAKIFQADTGGD